jgi:hypothetical protein
MLSVVLLLVPVPIIILPEPSYLPAAAVAAVVFICLQLTS